jgi:uroporphyrinogen III methyltransferase/synthase
MTPSSARLPGDDGDVRLLAGRTVVVTRPAAQAAALAEPLTALGATVVVAPLIEIAPVSLNVELRAAITDLPRYDLVIFTSASAVEEFLARVSEVDGEGGRKGGVAAAFAPTALAAIGPKTRAALEQQGLEGALMPDAYVAEGLLATLAARGTPVAGSRMLIPRAREAREVLPEELRAQGATVDVVTVYDTLPVSALPVPADALTGADFITFTSSSAVHSLAALLGGGLAQRLAAARLCSIGPATSETLRGYGLPVAVEAAPHTAAALVAAILVANL